MIKTFLQKTWIKIPASLGFTLIEMLVVVCIIVLIAVFAMPTISSYFHLSLDSTSRRLAKTIQEAYQATLISGKIHRIVYDLKANTFWVEEGPRQSLLDTPESLEEDQQREKFFKPNEKHSVQPSAFHLDETITRKKVSLPQGVEYEGICNQKNQEPILEGLAYTHFFPNGFNEQTLIHLKDSSQHQTTLKVNLLLGSIDLYSYYASSQELFAE